MRRGLPVERSAFRPQRNCPRGRRGRCAAAEQLDSLGRPVQLAPRADEHFEGFGVQQVAEDESADGVEHHRRRTDRGIGRGDVAAVAGDLEAAGEPAVHPSLDLILGALQGCLTSARARRLEHCLARGTCAASSFARPARKSAWG